MKSNRGNNPLLVVAGVILLIIAAIFLLSKQNTTIAPEKTDESVQTGTNGSGLIEGDENGQAMTAIDVEINGFSYSPQTITIRRGESVTWKNLDSEAHTVTAKDGSFDSGNMDQGQTFTQQFDQAGTFEYICTYHPNMRATVVVQ